MALTDWTDKSIQDEYHRLTKLGWDRTLVIAKKRKDRHERIDFDNPLFIGKLNELEQEMKKRGLK